MRESILPLELGSCIRVTNCHNLTEMISKLKISLEKKTKVEHVVAELFLSLSLSGTNCSSDENLRTQRSCDWYLHLTRAKRHVHPAQETRQHGTDFIGDLNSMTDTRPHSIDEVQTGSDRHQLHFANGRAVYSSHVFLLGFLRRFNGIGSCGTNCKSRVWIF